MHETILTLIKKRWEIILVGLVLLGVFALSLITLTTMPQLWTDEAISIHIARSFMNHGVLSIQTAPDTFFESPHLIQATGYPITVPLAGFFKLFGYGVSEARTYMLMWIVVALVAVFFLARTLFSKLEAASAFLLTSSFASFYANGRTVTGEVPGSVLLLLGFYFLLAPPKALGLVRQQFFLAGIFWGFAVVAKPAVFALIIPTIFLTLFFERLSFTQFFKRLFSVAAGMIPAALAWIFLVLENPFAGDVWRELGAFYKNPYGEDITQNILQNLSNFFDSTTLIYFSGLFLLVVLAWLLIPKKSTVSFLYTFIIIYGLFAFAYYIRSSGYLRYILIAELLILFILPHAIYTIIPWIMDRLSVRKISVKAVAVSVIGALILIQGVHLFTAADISSSDSASKVAEYVNTQFPESSIGLLNAPILGLFTDPSRTFLPVYLLGLPPIGKNPLLLEEPPDIVVSYPSNRFIDEGRDVLDKRYASIATMGGYTIYRKKLDN